MLFTIVTVADVKFIVSGRQFQSSIAMQVVSCGNHFICKMSLSWFTALLLFPTPPPVASCYRSQLKFLLDFQITVFVQERKKMGSCSFSLHGAPDQEVLFAIRDSLLYMTLTIIFCLETIGFKPYFSVLNYNSYLTKFSVFIWSLQGLENRQFHCFKNFFCPLWNCLSLASSH